MCCTLCAWCHVVQNVCSVAANVPQPCCISATLPHLLSRFSYPSRLCFSLACCKRFDAQIVQGEQEQALLHTCCSVPVCRSTPCRHERAPDSEQSGFWPAVPPSLSPRVRSLTSSSACLHAPPACSRRRSIQNTTPEARWGPALDRSGVL
jgi:hypothetical protein